MKRVTLTRRQFAAVSAGGLLTTLGAQARAAETPRVPVHLQVVANQFDANPRVASIAWFHDAKFGLFMHYGVYSILGHGEWVMLREKIPVDEYAKLKDQFTAENFDAEFITDLALDAGMKYVNITSRHHDSFCLFRTAQTNFNSVDAPAKRDLVDELAEACHDKGLGLFLYYSYALDWKHPYFYSRDAGWTNARPAYDETPASYKFEKDADFQRYLDFVHAQLRELLTQYGPLAGIWLDPIMGFYSRPDLFPVDETYALIRDLQPHCLISFKQGANGDEDFVAPERKIGGLEKGGEVAARVWEMNKDKPKEICNTLQPRAWGYDERTNGQHRSADDVMRMLEEARTLNANLLLNTGPLPDGSIHPDDVATLREVGKRLRG